MERPYGSHDCHPANTGDDDDCIKNDNPTDNGVHTCTVCANVHARPLLSWGKTYLDEMQAFVTASLTASRAFDVTLARGLNDLLALRAAKPSSSKTWKAPIEAERRRVKIEQAEFAMRLLYIEKAGLHDTWACDRTAFEEASNHEHVVRGQYHMCEGVLRYCSTSDCSVRRNHLLQ
jgi:hypothetical protein